MRRIYSATWIFALWTLLGLLYAQADKPAASNEQIAQLIQQLGAATFAEREQASRALEALGEPALPALKEAAEKSDDVEIKRRASDLVRVIEARLAAQRRRAPTLLSVAYHQTPVGAVLDDLASKTGLSFHWNVPVQRQEEIRKKLITLRLDQRPLWEVVDKTVAACGLHQAFPQPKELADKQLQQVFVLDEGPPRLVPVAYSGVARFRLLELDWVKEKPGVKSSDMQMYIEMCLEPDRFVFQDEPTLREIRVLDKDGNPLPGKAALQGNSDPLAENPVLLPPQVRRAHGQFGAARIAGPSRPDKKHWRILVVVRLNDTDSERQPAQLHGSFQVGVLSRESVAIRDPLTAERRTYGQPEKFQVRLVEATRQGNQVKVVLERPAVQAGDPQVAPLAPNQIVVHFRGGQPFHQVELYDDQGNGSLISAHEVTGLIRNNAVSQVHTLVFQLQNAQASPARLVVTDMRPAMLELPFQIDLTNSR